MVILSYTPYLKYFGSSNVFQKDAGLGPLYVLMYFIIECLKTD